MEDQITTDRLNESEDPTTETQNADQLQSVRAELITLAEKHEINYSVAYIKKASQGALEKIKLDYERKQMEKTNEYLSKIMIERFSELMEAINKIDDAKSMEEELVHNELLERDLKNILGHITPYVPFMGLMSGAGTVLIHMHNKKPTDPEPAEN